MAVAPTALRGGLKVRKKLLMVTVSKESFGNPVQNKGRGENTGRVIIREQQDART